MLPIRSMGFVGAGSSGISQIRPDPQGCSLKAVGSPICSCSVSSAIAQSSTIDSYHAPFPSRHRKQPEQILILLRRGLRWFGSGGAEAGDRLRGFGVAQAQERPFDQEVRERGERVGGQDLHNHRAGDFQQAVIEVG